MSKLEDLQTQFEEWSIEHFTALECCRLNTDHRFNDKEFVVPPRKLWSNMERSIKFADTLRNFWDAPLYVGGYAGGGGYRPKWYQKGLKDKGITSTDFGDHCLFAGLDLVPGQFKGDKTPELWYAFVRGNLRQVERQNPELPTALGWHTYQQNGQHNIHVSIGVDPDTIGRSSLHARW